jgi:hypothetical protein
VPPENAISPLRAYYTNGGAISSHHAPRDDVHEDAIGVIILAGARSNVITRSVMTTEKPPAALSPSGALLEPVADVAIVHGSACVARARTGSI